jgi:ATP-dependent DNA helicase RecG
MLENQNIEFKESWRDEYLKWICGFANASGGRLYVGKNDAGEVVGVEQASKLLENLPNKIVNHLGIVVEINLKEEVDKEYIEIIVEAFPHPVSYKGEYHFRSGATKLELKGQALDRFLLKKIGKRWDSVPVPKVDIEQINNDTIEKFKKDASRSKRISSSLVTENDTRRILENLKLTDGQYLKRSAILLFGKNPLKYITGAFIKIGYFKTDSDLRYHDVIEGNIFEQVDKSMDLLFTKYIKANISYEGVQRVETYEFPYEAIREALLNAIVHKDYSGTAPIQISVYDEKLIIWNEGQLPEGWTIETLFSKHPSKPFNPDIADVVFKSGKIEAWGRGIDLIINDSINKNFPEPQIRYEMSGYNVIFRKDIYYRDYLTGLDLSHRQVEIVLWLKNNDFINNSIIQDMFTISKRTASRELSKLVSLGLIEKIGDSGVGTRYIIKKLNDMGS